MNLSRGKREGARDGENGKIRLSSVKSESRASAKRKEEMAEPPQSKRRKLDGTPTGVVVGGDGWQLEAAKRESSAAKLVTGRDARYTHISTCVHALY